MVAWIKAAGLRAFKTACQTAIGVIGAAAALGDVNWPMVGSAAVLAALVSLLTSVEGLPELSFRGSPAETADTSNIVNK